MERVELRERLTALGLSQREFARRLRVGHIAVNRWATGSRAVPGYAAAFLDMVDFGAAVDVPGQEDLTVNGHFLPRTGNANHYKDTTAETEVDWLNIDDIRHDKVGMRRFREISSSVAGGPPAAFEIGAMDLLTFHVLDVSEADARNWRFLHKGPTGVDSSAWTTLSDISSPALKMQAVESYHRSVIQRAPTYAKITRKAEGLETLIYTRLVAYQELDDGNKLLWVGLCDQT